MADPYIERELENERIDKMYEEVEAAIIAALLAALATGEPDKVVAAAATSKEYLYAAYGQVQVWHDEAIPALYGKQTNLTTQTTAAIKAASERRFYDMTMTVSRRIDDLADAFLVQHARIQALADYQAARPGMAPDALAADLEEYLRQHGITGFTDAAGRKWRLKTYAEMAARTTTMEAQNAGVKDRMIAKGSDLVNIIGPMDYPDGCPPSVLAGPYSITGATPDVMTLEQAIAKFGVFHPRCRHSLAPA